MALMILITGAYLCKAAEFPMPLEMIYPCMLYAGIWDLSIVRKIGDK